MKKKSISTATYLLKKNDEKFFGGIKGFAYLPEYNTEIKFFIYKNKIDKTFDVENAETFKLDLGELEMVSKGTYLSVEF